MFCKWRKSYHIDKKSVLVVQHDLQYNYEDDLSADMFWFQVSCWTVMPTQLGDGMGF